MGRFRFEAIKAFNPVDIHLDRPKSPASDRQLWAANAADFVDTQRNLTRRHGQFFTHTQA